ncbi:MAG: lipopolysaccharide biosynthesis protein [Actinomycetota bacterium]|nr:lipopolysaccharide biosynthesis protein [Actinomycetota bacterium]
MEERAIRGIPWTLLAYGGNKFLTVATTLVLARLLVPEDFGLAALAWMAMVLFTLFRDLGVGGVLIMDQELDEHAKGTIFTLVLTTGVVATTLAAAVSPVAATVFEEPRLTLVLVVLSSTMLISSPGWFYEALMQRELEFRKRFWATTMQSLVYLPVAVSLAALGAGVWSLIVGQIAGTIVYTVAFVVLAPYRVRPAFGTTSARRTLRLGRGFIFQGGLDFLRGNADTIAISRVLGTAPLGLYSLAYNLSNVPSRGIADPLARVTFPAFARMRGRGEDVGPSFLSGLQLVALVTCPLGVVLSGVADPFVRAVLGEKWVAMTGALAVLGIWAAARSIEVTMSWLLNSVGRADLLAGISGVVLLVAAPMFFVAAELGGIEAVAWVAVGDMVASLLAIAWHLQRREGIALVDQWRVLWPVLAAGTAAWGGSRAIADALDGAPAAVALIAGCAAGALVYAAVVNVLAPTLFGSARRQVARAIGRRRAVVAGT